MARTETVLNFAISGRFSSFLFDLVDNAGGRPFPALLPSFLVLLCMFFTLSRGHFCSQKTALFTAVLQGHHVELVPETMSHNPDMSVAFDFLVSRNINRRHHTQDR